MLRVPILPCSSLCSSFQCTNLGNSHTEIQKNQFYFECTELLEIHSLKNVVFNFLVRKCKIRIIKQSSNQLFERRLRIDSMAECHFEEDMQLRVLKSCMKQEQEAVMLELLKHRNTVFHNEILKLSWMMFLLKFILALVMFSFLFANQFLRSYFRIGY